MEDFKCLKNNETFKYNKKKKKKRKKKIKKKKVENSQN